MAYEDYSVDPMGNYTGGYSVDQEAEAIAQREEEEKKRKQEEERLRKEAERIAKERDNLAVHKQEVTTYANGSKTITNTAEIPATSNAPGRPNVKGPVAPDTFGRMQQAESGNRDFDAQGRPITSPVGAMFKNQVMPATAANPGYGIRPASAQTPEEYNRVGQEYYDAMLKKFGGNEQAAVAAYNAGPGRVEQNIRRNQGQLNVAQLPNETQGYLNKVLGGVGKVVNAVIPSAMAAPAPQMVRAQAFPEPGVAVATGKGVQGTMETPQGPVAPDDSIINDQVADYERRQAEAQQQAPAQQGPVDPNKIDYGLATGTGEPGIKVPGMKPTGVASSAPAIEAYSQIQDNPMELMKLGVSDDPNTPKWIKERARNRAADLVQQEREMAKAKEQVANMSPNETAKVLRKKGEEGSAVKMFIYNMLGMTANAAEEADKLGLGKEQAVMGSDGKAYLIKVGYNGKPLSGYNPETGKDLSNDELIKVAAGVTTQKGVHQPGDVYKDPSGKVKGSFVLETRPGQTPVYKEVGSGRIATAEEGAALIKTGVAGTLENQLASQRQKLMEQTRFMGPQEKIKFYGKFDAENGTNFLQEFQSQNPEYFTQGAGGAKPAVQGGAVPPTPLPAGTQAQGGAPAPAQNVAPAGTAVAPGQTPAAIASARKQAEAEQAANTQVSVDARKDYNQYIDKELVAKVPNATKISRIRSSQLDGPDGLLAVPEVAGIMAGGGSAGREVGNIIRDMITGQFTSVEDLNKRVVGLGLQNSNPKVYNALMTQIRLQQELGPLTIKETAPVGAISDSEQKMNTSNQIDVTRNPAYVTFNLLSKNKFQTDLTQAKADFAAKHPELDTIAKFNQAWTKEEGKLYKQYDDIYAARAAYVGEHKNTPMAAAAGYKLFPVPQWDAEKGTFEYKGQPYAKKRPPIDSFVR